MAENGLAVGSEAYIKFEAVASVGQGLIEGSERVFRNRFQGAGAAMAKKQGTAHTVAPSRELIKIEVTDGLAGVGSFFRFPDRFLELLFEKVGSVPLSLHRLLEDRFAAAVLFAHGFGRSLHVIESFWLDRRGVGDDGTSLGVNLEHRAAAGAGYFEVGGGFRH